MRLKHLQYYFKMLEINISTYACKIWNETDLLIHSQDVQTPYPNSHSVIIVVIVNEIIMTIQIMITLITLIHDTTVRPVATDETVLGSSQSRKCLIRINILLPPLLALGVETQLPEIQGLEKDFGMRLEHVSPMSGFAGEGISIHFKLFIGDWLTSFD